MTEEINDEVVVQKSRPGPIWQYISPAGLQKLLDYKYVSGQNSLGDKMF